MRRTVSLYAVVATATILRVSRGVVSQVGHASDSSKSRPYLNPRLPVDQRVRDLLSRMTLQERVGQLETPLGWEMYQKARDAMGVSRQFEKLMAGPELGTLYGVPRADPWTKATLETGLSPRQATARQRRGRTTLCSCRNIERDYSNEGAAGLPPHSSRSRSDRHRLVSSEA
jgi:hypothetical protein